MKKVFLSPFFMPVAFLCVWLSLVGIMWSVYSVDVLELTKEGQIIESVVHVGYVILIAYLLLVANDYKEQMSSWGCFLFLAMCAFLREAGIQHHLSKTDTTPFKSRFFLNPNNPLGEKIVYGLLLLVIVGAVVYLAVKYSKHLVKSFFKLDTITWSIATMCTVGVCAKLVDRFPANWRKVHGVKLPDDVYAIFQLVEESSEMFLPYIAILILLQYHIKKYEA